MGKTRLKSLTLYVSAEEYDWITADAQGHGLTTSTYLRALINQYTPVKLPPLPKGAPTGNTNRQQAGRRQTNDPEAGRKPV